MEGGGGGAAGAREAGEAGEQAAGRKKKSFCDRFR